MDLIIEYIPLLSCLAFCLLIELIYYWLLIAKPYYLQQKRKKETAPDISSPPVSVIISIQDGDPNLEETIKNLLEQDYLLFELIVVKDNLDEDNNDILKRLSLNYPHLYHTYIPDETRNLSRKKLCLTLGVKAAKYDSLLFTELDSIPASNQWIKSMSSHFSDKHSIVLGFSALRSQKGLGGKYRFFDYLFVMIQMISMAIKGRPFGANGRNMGYAKTYFSQQKGYSRYRFLESGEDDLFINEIADKKNLDVDVSPDGLVYTKWDDSADWKRWKHDKTFTRKYYKKADRFLWQFESFIKFVFLSLVIYTLIATFNTLYIPIIALSMYLIRLFSQLFVFSKTARSLNLRFPCLLFPLFDLIQPFVNTYYYIYSIVKTKYNYTWRISK